MSIINFTRKPFIIQSIPNREGFLCIELLQGLLVLGALLLLVSSYLVLSLHWQGQAIKRLEALNAVSNALATDRALLDQAAVFKNDSPIGITIMQEKRMWRVPEFKPMIGEPVYSEQIRVTAQWRDGRGRVTTIVGVSS